jgi:hypothetical protein
MNLLHLVPKGIYDTKMSRVRFEEVAELPKANPPMQVQTTGPGWPDWPDGIEPVEYIKGFNAAQKGDKEAMLHAVLSYEVTGLAQCPIPAFTIFHETYNFPKTMTKIHDVGAHYVIFTYANDLPLYGPILERNGYELAYIPHSATQSIYNTTAAVSGAGKGIDVLIVGNLAEQFYPFRYRLSRLAKREIAKRGYTVVHLPHPGFTSRTAAEHLPERPGTFSGPGYADWLRQAKLVVTCCSRQKYAFCKLVEIPLCGALPLSDLPNERQGFFQQTVLNVEPWMTDREILYKVEEVLDEDDLRQRLTTVAHDKVAARLEMRHWAERFIYLVRRALGEDPPLPTPPVGDEDKR